MQMLLSQLSSLPTKFDGISRSSPNLSLERTSSTTTRNNKVYKTKFRDASHDIMRQSNREVFEV